MLISVYAKTVQACRKEWRAYSNIWETFFEPCVMAFCMKETNLALTCKHSQRRALLAHKSSISTDSNMV